MAKRRYSPQASWVLIALVLLFCAWIVWPGSSGIWSTLLPVQEVRLPSDSTSSPPTSLLGTQPALQQTYILIVNTPKGEASEEVRQLWVGCILPVDRILLQVKATELETGDPRGPTDWYVVSGGVATNILGQKDHKGEEWFNDRMDPNSTLAFQKDEAEVVSSHQEKCS